MSALLRAMETFCGSRALSAPSRATVYKLLAQLPGHRHRVADLPACARRALYNLDASASVPGAQLAFHCFNYGDLAAITFAAGLPWLDLYQAQRVRGWRPKSRGLIEAVARVRGL